MEAIRAQKIHCGSGGTVTRANTLSVARQPPMPQAHAYTHNSIVSNEDFAPSQPLPLPEPSAPPLPPKRLTMIKRIKKLAKVAFNENNLLQKFGVQRAPLQRIAAAQSTKGEQAQHAWATAHVHVSHVTSAQDTSSGDVTTGEQSGGNLIGADPLVETSMYARRQSPASSRGLKRASMPDMYSAGNASGRALTLRERVQSMVKGARPKKKVVESKARPTTSCIMCVLWLSVLFHPMLHLPVSLWFKAVLFSPHHRLLVKKYKSVSCGTATVLLTTAGSRRLLSTETCWQKMVNRIQIQTLKRRLPLPPAKQYPYKLKGKCRARTRKASGLQSWSDPKSFEWHNCTITKLFPRTFFMVTIVDLQSGIIHEKLDCVQGIAQRIADTQKLVRQLQGRRPNTEDPAATATLLSVLRTHRASGHPQGLTANALPHLGYVDFNGTINAPLTASALRTLAPLLPILTSVKSFSISESAVDTSGMNLLSRYLPGMPSLREVRC
jgi:hypothetical protein